MSGAKKKPKTEAAPPDLDAMVAYWQPLLRLADWDISVGYERHRDGSMCSRQVAYKRAKITMQHPIDVQPGAYQHDMERVFVHELLHLHFAPFDTENDSPMGIAEEQAVESLARAFVALKRSKR